MLWQLFKDQQFNEILVIQYRMINIFQMNWQWIVASESKNKIKLFVQDYIHKSYNDWSLLVHSQLSLEVYNHLMAERLDMKPTTSVRWHQNLQSVKIWNKCSAAIYATIVFPPNHRVQCLENQGTNVAHYLLIRIQSGQIWFWFMLMMDCGTICLFIHVELTISRWFQPSFWISWWNL